MRVSTALIHMQGVRNMQQKQADLLRSHDQISSGKRLLSPSDDPSAASRIIDLKEAINQITQLDENANYAIQQLNLEEVTLDSSNLVLQRVRELSIQAANTGVNNLQSEQAIASEVREKLEELFDYANTKDENGDFIFSGFQSKQQAFTTDGNGNYSYNGDEGQLSVQIGSNRQVVASDSGAEVFQKIRTGNGTFAVDANSTNGGTARITTGSVISTSQYQAHDFRIVFDEVSPATTPTSYTYSVYDDTLATGVPILAAQPYSDGAAIAFNGIEVEINGDPVDGDIFTVEASRYQDVFKTISDLVGHLEAPGTGDVRGVIGGDFINNGFDNVAGDSVAFDIDFDGVNIPGVTVAVGVGNSNTVIAQTMLDAIGTAAGVAVNTDGSYTVPGTTAGVSVTFRRVGDNVEFLTTGGTLTNLNSLQISNLADAASDAVLDISGSGNSVSTQTTLDASVAGDSATYLTGAPHRSYLSQQIDNALNNIDRVMDNIINVTTRIGGRLNSIDSQRVENESKSVHLETVRSDIEDLDLAEAISNMTFQTTALQAAQQTFVRVQNLSLFNFL